MDSVHIAPANRDTHHAEIDTIVSFWFNHKEPMKVWFSSSKPFDDSIKTNFGPLMEAASRGELDNWQHSPKGALALLILLDQFPRNVFRGEARAFATDSRAVQVALTAIARGFDREVPFVQQVFFYLPLEHDEDLKSQVACVALVEALMGRAQPQDEAMAQAFYDFAQRHQSAILACGRYPSRNQALGRTSTAAEETFLRKHPMGY